jgi:predicted RNA-binding protein with PUA-like domain
MAYWLLKTEPSTYSFADLERDKQTRWDGISNPVALKNLRTAAAGDRAFVYHTGDEKAVVGICEIVAPAYDDPKNPKLAVVDVRAKEKLGKPVTLATLKADPAFSESPLVRQGRLSFVPISEKQWARVLHLSR